MGTRVGGIAGKLSFCGRSFSDDEFSSLVEAVPHRSTGGAEVLRTNNGALVVSFLRTRSNTTTITSKPVRAHFSAVIHGDIHNVEEVLSKLGRERDATQTSLEELIVASYVKWGDLCPLYLIGDYAFAIWDAQKEELFCARDAIGIKPFHYFFQDGVFVFGSEIDQVATHPNACEALDDTYILSFVNDEICDRESTFFQKIKRLPAAHCIRVSADGLSQSRYWNPVNLQPLEYQTLEQYVDEFEELLSNAILVRMPEQAQKLGVLLSGGVDSTSVLAVARAVNEKTQGNNELQALSLAFSGLPCDESQVILANAGKLGVPVHLHQHGPVLKSDVQKLVTESLAPPDSVTALAYTHLFNFARKNDIQVIMGGWGADDWLGLFGGIYHDLLTKGQVKLLLQQFGRNATRSGIGAACRRVFSECVRAPLARQVKRFALAHKLSLFEGRADYVSDFDRAGWRIVNKWNQYRWLNSPLFAINCEMQELSAARCGVEARYPYNDRRIVEFGLKLDSTFFARSVATKPLIRSLLCRIAPEINPESYLDPEGSSIYWQSLRQLYSDGDYDVTPLGRYLSIPRDFDKSLAQSLKSPEYDERVSSFLVRKQWNSYTVARWLEHFFAPENRRYLNNATRDS